MNKKMASFTEIVKSTIEQFKTKAAFYNAVKINKAQMSRLLAGKHANPTTHTLTLLSKITKKTVEELRNSYNQEFQKNFKEKNYDDEIRLNLYKTSKAEIIFNYFKEEDIIVETNFNYQEINYNSSKSIYDFINHLNLTSKLIKEDWYFSDYYKFLPSSLGDFHKERENEDIAKISFINEMQTLINRLNKDNNYIFLNIFHKSFKVSTKDSYSSFGTSTPVLKVVLSNSEDKNLKINEKRIERKVCGTIAEYNNAIREIQIKINEKRFLEEEFAQGYMEDIAADNYAELMSDIARGK